MSGSKSVDKTARAQETKRLQNRVLRGRTRTLLRQAREAVASEDAGAIQATSGAAVSALDRAVTKGLFHKNKASRLKSRLTRRVNASLSGKQSA